MFFSQYGSYLYMYVLFLSMIPAVILGILGRRIKYYAMFVTALMVYSFVGMDVQFNYLIVFMIWEVGLIFIYFHLRQKSKNIWIYRLFLLLTVVPLLINKVSPLTEFKTIGFIGISYLSFRTIQMMIEIFDGSITEISLVNTLYFILFFPTFSSGPIDRSRRFEEDVDKSIPRDVYIEEYLFKGILKIVQGLVYKFAIAALIYMAWIENINPDKSTIMPIILYMYGYTLYLFFDFAGYSLIAVGTSYIFGVKVGDNFNKPFLSKDMKEFWTRWHISLSRWFGDYIYSRFVLGFMRKKKFKKRANASYVAQMITMTTMGFWHGLTWYYIVYGVYQGLVLVLTDICTKNSKTYKKLKNKRWFNYLQIFVTFHIICFGMLIFSGFLDYYL